jgi:dTDP-glucose pyrophosphorylase
VLSIEEKPTAPKSNYAVPDCIFMIIQWFPLLQKILRLQPG